jgi:hypothetical protein
MILQWKKKIKGEIIFCSQRSRNYFCIFASSYSFHAFHRILMSLLDRPQQVADRRIPMRRASVSVNKCDTWGEKMEECLRFAAEVARKWKKVHAEKTRIRIRI